MSQLAPPHAAGTPSYILIEIRASDPSMMIWRYMLALYAYGERDCSILYCKPGLSDLFYSNMSFSVFLFILKQNSVKSNINLIILLRRPSCIVLYWLIRLGRLKSIKKLKLYKLNRWRKCSKISKIYHLKTVKKCFTSPMTDWYSRILYVCHHFRLYIIL